jgi:NAD(P)-dependent dehydrogenase (short-subunit alcohol dehydrogenase family)
VISRSKIFFKVGQRAPRLVFKCLQTKVLEGISGGSSSPDFAALNASRAPAEFGAACAFLCSAHAGYIKGQNIVIDGGAFPGAF